MHSLHSLIERKQNKFRVAPRTSTRTERSFRIENNEEAHCTSGWRDDSLFIREGGNERVEQDACYRGSAAWCAREHGDPRQRRDAGADVVRAEFTKAFGVTPEIMTAAIPLGRMGIPEDIAESVGFLVSDRAAWITGSNFIIDGGQSPAV